MASDDGEAAGGPLAEPEALQRLQPRLRVWLMLGDTVTLGPGRAELLQTIDRSGSIKAAAAELNMSYRLAWGYLRDLEAAAGFPFIERHPGGGRARGTRLTPGGQQFLTRYWELRRRIEAAAAREFAEVFPGR